MTDTIDAMDFHINRHILPRQALFAGIAKPGGTWRPLVDPADLTGCHGHLED